MFLIFIINFLLAIATTVGMTIIPFIITDSLGLSLLILGVIEGGTEFLSNVIRLANGVLFDKIKNKRIVFIIATSIAFVTKLLLLMPNIWTITLSKTLERISNGAFASPRDAYVAEKAKDTKGFALGLLGFSKSAGCILGPLLISGYILLFNHSISNDLFIIIIFCCCLVFIAVICSCFLEVKELKTSEFSIKGFNLILKQIIPDLILIFLFFVGRFNDGLLMIYLKQKGFPIGFYLSSISIFNFTMLISSPIIGRQIDYGRLKWMIYISIIALIIFNFLFYQLNSLNWVIAILGLINWGIQRSGSQIVFASLIFKEVNKENYGTAIGIYYLVSGFATMLSSLMCGYLAQSYFQYVFILSGSFAVLALLTAYYMLSNNYFKLS